MSEEENNDEYTNYNGEGEDGQNDNYENYEEGEFENQDDENEEDFAAGDSQEVIITDGEDDGSFELTESQQYDPIPIQQLQSVVNTYSAYMYSCPAKLINFTNVSTIHLELPRSFLPLSLQAVYGFLDHANLLEMTIELDKYEWTRKPLLLKAEHPIYKDKYVGAPLVQTTCSKFFSEDYKPRPYYRSESYLLTPSGQADERKVATIVKSGFEQTKAENALVLCGNNVAQAIQFLKTGDLPTEKNEISIEYSVCPLLYLVFEIAECFLDLQDHCCICRAPLPPGLKPSICDNQLCTFQFTQIGIGTSVAQEIQRDYMAADLIFSIFSAAIGTKYFQPRPPGFEDAELITIANSLPAMIELRKCANDTELNKLIKPRALELLRWVLLSNRSHMLFMPEKMKFKQFGSARQYLSLISTPQAEREFKTLKEKHGTLFLFHGSGAYNWHSILRNGLKNASGTAMQVNGAALGSGIYFARNSTTSQGYAKKSHNNYAASSFGLNLMILALCEIAKVPELIDHGWAHTLTKEQACIVRFLLINGEYTVDVIENPPKNVPKLKDVLNYHAEEQYRPKQ